MGFSTHPLLPSLWFVQGIDGIRKGEWRESLFLLSLMATTAAASFIFLAKMADSLYLRGIDLMEGNSSSYRHKEVFWIRKMLFFLKPEFRALIIKDIVLFLRDSLQWSQFLIFFGILFIYILNLPRVGYEIDLPYFKSLTFFLNISAIGLVISTLTTRFLFPLISLEGKRFWILGLSPITRKGLLLEKLFLSSFLFLLITESLMALLNHILKTDGLAFFFSQVFIAVMTITLTSVSIGLGAVYPVFSKEDTSSIVSSLGGTINAIISLLYVLFSVALVAIPVQMYILHRFPYRQLILYLVASISIFIAVSLFCSLMPIIKGVRSLEEVEA
jgi:ABC-2 type transport system permease protein